MSLSPLPHVSGLAFETITMTLGSRISTSGTDDVHVEQYSGWLIEKQPTSLEVAFGVAFLWRFIQACALRLSNKV